MTYWYRIVAAVFLLLPCFCAYLNTFCSRSVIQTLILSEKLKDITAVFDKYRSMRFHHANDLKKRKQLRQAREQVPTSSHQTNEMPCHEVQFDDLYTPQPVTGWPISVCTCGLSWFQEPPLSFTFTVIWDMPMMSQVLFQICVGAYHAGWT